MAAPLTNVRQAEAMDHIYRYQRAIYDVTRRYYLLGRNGMIADLAPPPGGSVLEIGCGTARNLVQAAGRYSNAQFYGFDISTQMLKTAAKSVAASPFSDRIHLAEGDATNFDARQMFAKSSFDRIYVSYSLSMIPKWESVIEAAVAHLAPGGALHIVDFGGMQAMPRLARQGLLRWLAHFAVTPRRNLQSIVGDAALRLGLKAEFAESRSGYVARACLRRP